MEVGTGVVVNKIREVDKFIFVAVFSYNMFGLPYYLV